MASEYKSRGGSYIGPKDDRAKHLDQWTREDWQMKDGDSNANTDDNSKPEEVSHRYLPKKAWAKMGEEEKEETERRKVEGSLRGEQFVGNTEEAIEAKREAAEEVREGMEEEEQGMGKIVGGGGEVEHEDAAKKQGGKTKEGIGGAEQAFRPKKHDALEKERAEVAEVVEVVEVVDSQDSAMEVEKHEPPKRHFGGHKSTTKKGGESAGVKAAKQHFIPKTHKVNQPTEYTEPTKGSESNKQKEGGEIEIVEEGGEEGAEEPADDGSGEYKPKNEEDVVTEEVDTPTVTEADNEEDMTHIDAERILDAEEKIIDLTTKKDAISVEIGEEAEYSPDIETVEEVIEDEDYVDKEVDEEVKKEKPQRMTKNRQQKLEGKVSKQGVGAGGGKHAGDKRKASGGGGKRKIHEHGAVEQRRKAGQMGKNVKGDGEQVFKPKKQKTRAS